MEDKNVDVSISGGAPASSRWNPTKEQISMLEGLYRQGIRTPSAEQIQQITTRLKVHGHIEGKNVFYWFQNHKARQRQKQKQESMVYTNRFLHKAAPIFVPPPCTNVVCSPFYIPQSGIGYYPQYPNELLPGGVRRARIDKVEKRMESAGAGYERAQPRYDMMHGGDDETLQLFPLHPTGILEGRSGNSFPSSSAENSNPSSSSENGVEVGSGDQPFFDFFAEHGSSESE